MIEEEGELSVWPIIPSIVGKRILLTKMSRHWILRVIYSRKRVHLVWFARVILSYELSSCELLCRSSLFLLRFNFFWDLLPLLFSLSSSNAWYDLIMPLSSLPLFSLQFGLNMRMKNWHFLLNGHNTLAEGSLRTMLQSLFQTRDQDLQSHMPPSPCIFWRFLSTFSTSVATL